MDTIRKRIAQSNEQCEETSAATTVAQHDKPARPLDLLFPPDAFVSDIVVPEALHAPTPDDQDILRPVAVPLLRRIRSKPRRLAAPVSLSAPDWSLSLGAAVVVLGFAIVFGTWATLTERDAMQSRLRQIVSQNESRAVPGHERATIADRTQELAHALGEQIETLRGRDAVGAAVVAGTAASLPAKAHNSTLASSAPALPPGPPPSDAKLASAKTPAKPAIKSPPPTAAQPQAKVMASRPVAPPLPSLPQRAPQPAPRAHQLANTAAPPVRVASTAQHDQKTNTATSTCATRAPCSRGLAQSASKPVKTATANPHKSKSTVVARNSARKNTVKPVQYAGPPTMQAYVQPESPIPPPAGDDKEVYRQH